MENINVPENEIIIKHIYNMQILRYTEQFIMQSTYNNDWRLLCIYRGEVETLIYQEWIPLVAGHMILIPPGIAYGLRTSGKGNPEILSISLSCSGKGVEKLAGKVHPLSQENFSEINDIASEAKCAFFLEPDTHQNDHYLSNRSISASTRQILKNKLEIFLLRLFERNDQKIDLIQQSPSTMLSKQLLIDQINEFFVMHLADSFTLQEISDSLHFSPSYLNSVYREATGQSIISAFNQMKIEWAKSYLESNTYSITRIAECLGFSSIHYFSRVFKKVTGIAPTEYLDQIHLKKRNDENE